MKTGLLILGMMLLATSDWVNADWKFSVEGGLVQNEMPRDGTYWQNAFDHESDMSDFSYSIGAVYEGQRARFIAAWDNLGQHTIDSMAVLGDPLYSPMGGCWNEVCRCASRGLFRTKEDIQGLRLALATPGDGFYAETGVFLYKASTDMRVYFNDGSEYREEGDGKLMTGFEVATGWVFKNDAFVKVRYYDLGGSSGLPVMSESAWTVTLGKEF